MCNFSINKTNNAVRKQAKYMNRYFTEENTWMTNKHMEKTSLLLAFFLLGFRIMEIKIIICYHYTNIRMAKNSDKAKNW